MKKLLCCLAALFLLLTTAALADVTVRDLESTPYFSTATNCYYMRVNGGYQIFDAQGKALSDVYSDLTTKQNGSYYTYSGSGLNYMGLLDAQGQVLCTPTYGHISFMDDNWALAYVLEPTDADTGDFKDSDNNKYLAARTDVLYQGHVLISLTREEYAPSWTEGTIGTWLYLKKSSTEGMYISPTGTVTRVMDEFAYGEFTDLGRKGIRHNLTQQMAFCAGCTLTKDDVETWVWFDTYNDNLIDLQGNVIKSGVMYDSVKQYGDYLLIRHNGKYGIMDLQGNVIAEPIYGDISYSEGLFCNGYQAVLTEKGCLQYLDTQGNVITGVDYELSSSDYKGYYYNAPFMLVNNMGKYIVITAEAGELPTKYEDYQVAKTYQNILLVQKDGLWGAIDLWGNTVIPFENTNLTLSLDGTVACGRDTNYINHIYIVTSDAAAADDAPAAAVTPADDGSWVCTCGHTNTGKFCANCGSAKPVPVDDGSWNCACGYTNTGKFCPNCGSAKPAAPTEPQCSSCGYKPEGETPKFCPECGTKF